ncbi:MAG TPA: helix-turn-helix domain-containing protein [Dehalococcoidales bacterium]|nr:helix-turn-helix domain-containing protein [Dehalococcoidales bacterium]
MLTTGEVARMLNVHPGTVRRWHNREILKGYRIGPRADRRYRREDIELFLRKSFTSPLSGGNYECLP